MRRLFLFLLLAGCLPTEGVGDGGADAGTGPGAPPDAGAALVLDFEPVALPAASIRTPAALGGTTLFANTVRGIEASTDLGATWQLRTSRPGSLTVGADGRLYLLSNGVQFSDDGLRTFTSLGLPVGLDAGSIRSLHATNDGALWLMTIDSPPALYRFVDAGTFESWPVPTNVSAMQPCASLSNDFVAMRGGGGVLRWRDGGVEVLGDAGLVTYCVATPTGAVIASSQQQSATLRWGNGATDWDRTPSALTPRFKNAPGQVLRWQTAGRVEVSADDGLTWTQRLPPEPSPFAIDDVFLVGDTLVAGSSLGQVVAGPTDLRWRVTTPVQGVPGGTIVELAFAEATPDLALLIDEGSRRTVVTSGGDGSWRRVATFQGAQGVRTIALSPEGRRVFVGGTLGHYWFVDDAGVSLQRTVSNVLGVEEHNELRQAIWRSDPAGSFVMVSSASDADNEGAIWQLDAEATHFTWVNATPVRASGMTVRPGGYHALTTHFVAPAGRGLVASMRSFVTTATWINTVFTWAQLFNANREWDRSDSPVAVAAISAHSLAKAGAPLAMLWPEDQLYLGRTADTLRRVRLNPNGQKATSVRFSNDGRLWLIQGQLLRSREPVVLP